MSELTEKDREDLVAYLDGELDPKGARDVEAKISVDARFRAEADALKHAWELLDYLPRAEPSASFAHRTLERLAITGPRPTGIMVRSRPWRWAVGLGWAAAVLLVAGLSFGAVRWLVPTPVAPAVDNQAEVEDQLARHLRVIQEQPLYEWVDDFQMLTDLDSPDLFGDDSGP